MKLDVSATCIYPYGLVLPSDCELDLYIMCAHSILYTAKNMCTFSHECQYVSSIMHTQIAILSLATNTEYLFDSFMCACVHKMYKNAHQVCSRFDVY